jgi:hypothetical protein
MVLAGAAYINDEASNVAETERVKELATYQTHRPEPPRNSEVPHNRQDQAHMHDSLGCQLVQAQSRSCRYGPGPVLNSWPLDLAPRSA